MLNYEQVDYFRCYITRNYVIYAYRPPGVYDSDNLVVGHATLLMWLG
jgi:hypothetical protein